MLPVGALSSDFLGMPLSHGGPHGGGARGPDATATVIGTPSADERLLAFVGQHIAAALERTATRPRSGSATPSSRSSTRSATALAKQLDFQGVIELVGERIRAIFEVPTRDHRALRPSRAHARRPRIRIDQGERIEWPPIGRSARVSPPRSSGPEGATPQHGRGGEAHGAIVFGSDEAESWLGVPILAGDRVLGVDRAGALPAYAFSESDERLLSTLASSMGVALENARLFDETKRLLAETERATPSSRSSTRSAGAGEAARVRGDRRPRRRAADRVCSARDMYIGLLDPETNLISFPYWVENGLHIADIEPIPLGAGLSTKMLETESHFASARPRNRRRSVLGGVWASARSRASGCRSGPGHGSSACCRLRGASQRLHESDERLLSTLATSMGVALENARLFDETKRLLAETEQRNAELAVVNEIGAALVEQLDFQAIIELVGERLAAIFNSRDMYIALYDRVRNQITFPYELDDGGDFMASRFPSGRD